MMIIQTPRSAFASVIDVVLTALAWAAFGFLLVSGILSIMTRRANATHLMEEFMPDVQTLTAYALVAASVGLLLAAWACYNALRFSGLDRRKHARDPLPTALADHFGISLAQLSVLRSSRSTRIHHTDEGQICMINFAHPPESVVEFLQMKQ
jgi:biofilm PGA synthesis protein PgaD